MEDERFYRDRGLRMLAAKVLTQAGVPRKCVVCGADRVQIHHVDGYELHNSLENLRYLCPACHSQVHLRHVAHRGETSRMGACVICGRKYRRRKRLWGFMAEAGFVCEECFDRRVAEHGIEPGSGWMLGRSDDGLARVQRNLGAVDIDTTL